MQQTDPTSPATAFDNRDLCLCWGKINEKPKSGPRIHRLIFHLLDVAAVAKTLHLREQRLMQRFTRLQGLPWDTRLSLLCFFAAAHDVGKASPGFQFLNQDKLHPILAPIWQELVAHPKLGTDFATWRAQWTAANKPPNHGYLSTLALFRFFNPELFQTGAAPKPDDSLSASVLWQLSTATGFHHDKSFKALDDDLGTPRVVEEVSGGVHWIHFRQALLRTLWRVLLGDAITPAEVGDALAPCATRQGRHWDPDFLVELLLFSGSTTVSDWIASNEKLFPFRDEARATIDFAAYFQNTLPHSEKMLNQLVWTGHHLHRLHAQPWSVLFPEINEPNVLQKKVLQLRDYMKTPTLIIIEGPMGIGKTEAALATLSAPSSNDRGFYVALPTQATGNQMYRRVQKFLDGLLTDKVQQAQLQLVHGNRFWNPDYTDRFHGELDGLGYLFETVSRDEGDDKAVVATEWAANARTGLLAEFGVGTIDSLLASVLLLRKHYFVRFLGVYGKTIIVDEVHANDTYMDGLFSRLLEWLGELGCHVVLLSATLPERKRREYLAAFRGVAKLDCEKAAYPRITTASRDQAAPVVTEHIPLASQRVKTVCLEMVALKSPTDVLKKVKADVNAAGDVGVFVIICSTVRFAQDLYQVFRDSQDFDDETLMLHHARFVLQQRVAHDAQVTEQLGKKGFPSDKEAWGPRPLCILFGTSVLEQSLDYDCDHLYTFPCPIDLIFQRMGRLYRRFYWFPNKAFSTQGTVTVFHFGSADYPDFNTCGSQWVYSEYLLLRTIKELKAALNGSKNCDLNDRNDLDDMVQAVYADQTEVQNERERQARQKDKADFDKAHGPALASLLPRPQKRRWQNKGGFRSWFTALAFLREPDRGYTARNETRLGESAVQIVILVKQGDDLVPLDARGFPLQKIIVPQRGSLRDKTLVRALLKSSIFLTLTKKRQVLETQLKDFYRWDHSALRDVKKLIGAWDERKERVSFEGCKGFYYEPRRGFVEPNTTDQGS